MSSFDLCPLCVRDQSTELWSDERLRVIDANEPGWPGFTRVIWHTHVHEMTDLSPNDRTHLMNVVWTVEQTLRDLLAPTKINLAQLGNQVPHVHWHVIPRWSEDDRFPGAFWAPAHPLNTDQANAWRLLQESVQSNVPAFHHALRSRLGTSAS